MNIESFNKSESKYYTFIVKKTKNPLKEYYRIELTKLAELMGIDKVYSNFEVEDLPEFIELTETELIKSSERYAYFIDEKTLVYKMPKGFISDEITLEGYIDFPTGFYKSGGGFTDFFVGPSIKNGIEYFCDETEMKVKKFCISKVQKTQIKKVKGKINEIILSEDDFKKIFYYSIHGKQQGKSLANNSIAEFFHNKFPKISKYNPDKQESNLKKLFMSTMDDSLLGKFNANELEKIENFFQALLGKHSKKTDFLNRNLLKIKQISLDEILSEIKSNLDKKTKESTWQKFFEKNIFIFDSRYIDFIPKYNLKSGRTSEPDFLVYDIYGMVDIFEIKLPGAKLLSYDDSHDNYYWSPETSKAISQLEKYIHLTIENRLGIEKDIEKSKKQKVNIIKPKGVLVIGTRSQLDDAKKIEDFYILRSSLKNVEIVLYDEIYESLNNLKNTDLS